MKRPVKKLALIATLLLITSINASAQDYGLPELHVIKTVTLSPAYSCRSQEDSQKGYQRTALFLSDYSRRRNSPDLLFNGACRGEDYFQSSTAGDDMALIADLGADAPVEEITAHLAFNKQSVHLFDAYSKFAQSVKVETNHTYVVLLNKREIRGLFIFTVTNHNPNHQVELKYAVKEYQIMDVKAQSPGFDWGQNNSAAQTNPTVEKAQSKKQN
jgi:hypothetical protein